MKNNVIFFTGLGLLFLCACTKKPQAKKDAEFWYKKSLQELRLEQSGEVAWRKALGSVDQALAIDSKRERYWVLKGSLLLKLGMPALSVEAFEQALRCSTVPALRAEVLNNYACALAELGQEAKAFALWQDALAIPSYQTPEAVYCNQGQYWLYKKEYEKALTLFARAIEVGGEYSDAYFFRALTLYKLARYTQAHDVLVTLITFDPDYQPALELKRQLAVHLSSKG